MDKNFPVSLVAACKDFFGFLPDQRLIAFQKEYKQLTEKDKEEIREGLIKNGYNIHPLQPTVTQ